MNKSYNSTQLSRRDFIKKTTKVGTAIPILACGLQFCKPTKGLSKNDKVKIKPLQKKFKNGINSSKVVIAKNNLALLQYN